jgi:hypothetical protein
MLEELEGRVLLSGMQPGAGISESPPRPESLATLRAAVQADLQQIKTDEMQLQADLKTLRPQLKADQQALAAAIDALASTLVPLRRQYQADCTRWRSIIQADQQAVAHAHQSGGADAVTAAQAALASDRARQQSVLQGDAQQIRRAMDSDPAVHAVQVQLAADTAIVQADQEQLRKDYAQLRTHLEEQYAAGGTDASAAQASSGAGSPE